MVFVARLISQRFSSGVNGRGYRYPREIHLATLLLVTEEEEEQEVKEEEEAGGEGEEGEERVLGIASLRHATTYTTYRSVLSSGRRRRRQSIASSESPASGRLAAGGRPDRPKGRDAAINLADAGRRRPRRGCATLINLI